MKMGRGASSRGSRLAILVVAIALVAGCAGSDGPAVDRVGAPPDTGDGWATAAPSDVGLDPEPLQALRDRLAEENELNVHAFLVVKDDRLVFEEYFTGRDEDWGMPLGEIAFDRDTLHDLRSVTKSVTAALIGIAREEGLVPGVESTLDELFPDHDLAPGMEAVTLHDVLAMSAGIDWNEDPPFNFRNSAVQLLRSPDQVAFVLGRDVVEDPGTTFTYNGGLTELLGGLVERTSGMSVDEYARAKLFDPLGIAEFEWRRYTSGVPVASSGLRLRPRDLAKFGSLFLNEGRWQGRQVLPEAWVAESSQVYSEPSGTAGYGYLWWIQRYDLGDRLVDIPVASGLGGQKIFVIEELDMLVVINAGNYTSTDPVVLGLGERLLTEYVLPAAGFDGAVFVDGG